MNVVNLENFLKEKYPELYKDFLSEITVLQRQKKKLRQQKYRENKKKKDSQNVKSINITLN